MPGNAKGKVILIKTISLLAPKVFAASSYLMSIISIDAFIALIINGNPIIAHASAAPVHLNAKVKLKYFNKNFPIKPFIPKMISNIYPVTTGGKTKGKFRRLIKNFLNKNSFLAKKYPKRIANGKLNKDAINAIFRDK